MTDPTPQTTPTRDEAVPTGWKLVPVEPTPEMIHAACDATFGPTPSTPEQAHRAGYRAMLASAPAPASGVDAVREARQFDPYILKAMAENYAGGHCWDHLDGQACLEALALIESLQDRLASLSPAATPVEAEPVARQTPKQRVLAELDRRAALAKPASSHAGGPWRAEFGALLHEDLGGFVFTVSPASFADDVAKGLNALAALSQSTSGRVGE